MRRVDSLLGPAGIKKTKAPPLLRAVFVNSLRGFRRRGFDPESSTLLLGQGFALDYAKRTVFYPLDAPRRIDVAERQRPHPLLARTLLFSLSLLAERYGPETASSGGVFALYLHASAVACRKGVLLFCGESTFGKSTISGKLLTGFPKLEDDQTFVLLSGGNSGKSQPQTVVFGSPLRRQKDFRSPRALNSPTLPVAALFWLQKSPRMTVSPLAPSDAATQNVSLTIHWNEPAAVMNRLKMLKQLVTAVPCYTLEFYKQRQPLVDLLRSHDLC
ncbi:MAG TPA: hypothetical protein VEK08_02700 [Planctomycetota bacterium]|nr:hypothetical protein [Planctomycetota bacterium]